MSNTQQITRERDQQNVYRGLLVALYFTSAMILIARLYFMARAGGTSWQQADWLINFASGPLRRGISGEFFIAVSDLTGLGVVELVCLVQALLVVAVIMGLGASFWRLGPSRRLLLVAVSPAFLFFWVYDPLAGFRKELIGYFAFLPLLACSAGMIAKRSALILSFAIFAIGVAFHEVNAFLSPFLLAAFLFCDSETVTKRFVLLSGGLLAAVSLAGLAYAVAYPSIASSEAICAEVIARGAAPDLCNGIFKWLEMDIGEHRETTRNFALLPNILLLVISYVLLFSPLFLLMAGSRWGRWPIVGTALSFVVFLPLYVMTVDWGRWLAMNFTAVTFVALVALLRFPDCFGDRSIRTGPFVLVLGLSLLYGFFHVNLAPMGGYAIILIRVLKDPSILAEVSF